MQPQARSNALPATTLFEIKLCSDFGKHSLVFSTVQADEAAAAEYGRAMLDRHDNFEIAEIWQGMKMLRQV